MGLMDSIKDLTGVGKDGQSVTDSIKDMASSGVMHQVQDSIKNYNTAEITNPTIRTIAETVKNSVSNLNPNDVDDYIQKVIGFFKK